MGLKQRRKKKLTLKKLFADMPDTATIQPYNNSAFVGFVINWSLAGVGFGELVLSYDKENKIYKSDVEHMSAKLVEKILRVASPQMAKMLFEIDGHTGKPFEETK